MSRQLDFVHDQFARSRRFRILNIVDDVTRECLAAMVENADLPARCRAGRASHLVAVGLSTGANRSENVAALAFRAAASEDEIRV
jgi:hypothetical protein